MDNQDGILVEINNQILRCYRNGDLWRRSKTGNYKLVKTTANNSDGYYQIACNGKMFRSHRIIYYAFNQTTFDIYDTHIVVDHIDGNPLNNSLVNLRAGTQQMNLHNNHKAKGYSWCNKRQHWRSNISVNNKRINLGLSKTRWEARQKYLDAIPKYHPTCPVHLYTNDEDDCPFVKSEL